jgi:hypothetical protein
MYPEEIILTISGVGLVLYGHFSGFNVLIDSFGKNGVVFLSGMFLLLQFFHSIHSAKIVIHPDKVVFYKIIGFTKLDIYLQVVSTFFLSGVIFSLFFGVAFNILVMNIGIWVAFPYSLVLVVAVLSMLFLLSKTDRNPRKRKKASRYSSKLLSNKRIAYIMKEVSEISSHPNLILFHLFIVLVIWFFIFIKLQSYVIVVFIICFLNALYCYDSYEADGKRYFLYKFLNFSKYRIFKYKLFVSVTFGLFWVITYTLLYLIFVGSFSWTIMLLPIVLLNALAQHAALGIICCKNYPYVQSFPVAFFGWTVLSAIPVLSLTMIWYAYIKMLNLRKAGLYA